MVCDVLEKEIMNENFLIVSEGLFGRLIVDIVVFFWN